MTLIFLVGGSRLFRSGLKFAIEDAGAKVVGECGSVEELRRSPPLLEESPIFLFKPAETGEMSDQIPALRRIAPEAHVVVVLSRLAVDDLLEAFSAGADGLLLEDISSLALCESLKLIELGEKVFPSQLATLLGGERRSPLLKTDKSAPITKRELEILGCLTAGMCNKSIANELGLAVATVKVHVKSLLKKLGMHNRTQAAIWAVNAGLVAAPSVLVAAASLTDRAAAAEAEEAAFSA